MIFITMIYINYLIYFRRALVLAQKEKTMNPTEFNVITSQTYRTKRFTLQRPSVSSSATEKAKSILADVMPFRRVPKTEHSCGDVHCEACAAPHLSKVIWAVERNKPIPFVLPAFPGKSPNPQKVLGLLPDQAERLSLRFLEKLCENIATYYAPGAEIRLCSDGRVFSDVVGMREDAITAYQVELDRLIDEMSLSALSTFNLDAIYNHRNFVHMRAELMQLHGAPLDVLKQKIRKGAKPTADPEEKEANRMYRGMTRFLFEDAMHPGQTKSRSKVQKEARSKAYEVIRRSNAWSALLAAHFPQAVRLSIHPQACGSKKLGIRLIGNESWMTPWHGVAVETKEGYTLLKRSEAEALGATLLYAQNGKPSHYSVLQKQNPEKRHLSPKMRVAVQE